MAKEQGKTRRQRHSLATESPSLPRIISRPLESVVELAPVGSQALIGTGPGHRTAKTASARLPPPEACQRCLLFLWPLDLEGTPRAYPLPLWRAEANTDLPIGI